MSVANPAKPRIEIGFDHYWKGFDFEIFLRQFPMVAGKYELVPSARPQVVFYSIYAPDHWGVGYDGRYVARMPVLADASRVRVFLTGENVEPDMAACDFAISFSRLVSHPNHLRLPLWTYDMRRAGYAPSALVKDPRTDWEAAAARQAKFCNFIYSHDVDYRNHVLERFARAGTVESAGRCRNSLGGWQVPGGMPGKIAYQRDFRFSLAVENSIWPGYVTEKLVEPMLAGSLPVYLGDPQVHCDFNSASFLNFASFATLDELIDRVRALDASVRARAEMLAQPWYTGNTVPAYARDETVLAFFDRIFAAAGERGRRS
jgi:hypothetical protein